MSIPKNHHYVPRVHIRKFKNQEGKYSLFLKDSNSFVYPKTSKHVFVKNQLNTIGDEFNQKDHFKFENDLAIKFDNRFNYFYNRLNKGLRENEEIDNEILIFFFEYSIIGYLRRLKLESQSNNDFISDLENYNEFDNLQSEIINSIESNKILNEFNEEDKKIAIDEFEMLFNLITESKKSIYAKQKHVKYPLLFNVNVKSLIPLKLNWKIFNSKENSFVLPDCTAFILPLLNSTNKTSDFKIEYIGIPLSSSVYLEIYNGEINDIQNEKHLASSFKVDEINKNLYSIAFNQLII